MSPEAASEGQKERLLREGRDTNSQLCGLEVAKRMKDTWIHVVDTWWAALPASATISLTIHVHTRCGEV